MIIQKIFIVSFFLLSFSFALGQSGLTPVPDSLSLDNGIRYGRLGNGFTYYIKTISTPHSKVYLNFYVKAGTNHQDSSQLNIAHAVEHLAFKSSEHFPQGIKGDQSLINSLGMSQFDVYGSSGRYHTEYNYEPPSLNKEALETGLLWFQDIASGLKLTDEDIDSERGILTSELIMRSGDNFKKELIKNKLRVNLIPCTEDLTNFFDHHKNFNPEILRGFYKDWYRPDLMALVIVGNIPEPESLEKYVIKKFEGIPALKNPRKVENCDSIYFTQPPLFVTVEEPDSLNFMDQKKIDFELFFRYPNTKENLHSVDGINRLVKWSLLTDILNKRLQESTNTYNSSFKSKIEHTHFSPIEPSSLKITITSEEKYAKGGIQETISLLHQIQDYGILDSEFRKAQEKQLQYLNIEQTRNPQYWLKEIKNHFIYGEALPSKKLTQINQWLSGYTPQEFNAFLSKANFKFPEDIGIITPSESQAKLYSENQIRSWINESSKIPSEPYKQPNIPMELMSANQKRSLKEKAYIEKGIGDLNVREFKLANGVKIIFKSYKPSSGVFDDKILLHGFKPNGASCFSKEDYFSAINAPGFIKNSGIGQLDKFEFQRYLSQSSMWWHGITPYIKNEEAGIKIDASLQDLEHMLQFVYLYFTNPPKNHAAFEDYVKIEKQLFQNQSKDLKYSDLLSSINKSLGGNWDFSKGTEYFRGLEDTEFERGYKIFQQLFGNSHGFTFIITGEFSIDFILPVVNKYLGNLSSSENKYSCTTQKPEVIPFLPQGPYYKEFFFPENSTKKNWTFFPVYINNADQYNWQEKIKVEALGALTNAKVWELRFEKRFSLYSVGTSGSFNEEMSQYEIRTRINCIPEDFPLIRQEFHAIISDLTSNSISKEFLDQSLQRMYYLNDPKGRGNENSEMQKKIYQYYRYGFPMLESSEITDFIKSLTPNDIIKTAQKYYKKENLYEFIMKSKNLEE